MAGYPGWWVPRSIPAWNGNQMWWWYLIAFLPSYDDLFADYLEKYIHICHLWVFHVNFIFCRILIVSIQNLGCCPCPRCLILLDHGNNMGRPRDMTQRRTLSQMDDIKRYNHVKAAHDLIYKKNNTVNGVAVERLLQEDSLVPTLV